jgi:L-alanine-DL-glutamate epimerase-like enolase superfamily enzyme
MTSTIGQRQLHIESAATKFAEPFRISGYVFDAMPSVRVTISQAMVSGHGEAAGVYFLGDGPDRMVADIERVRSAVEQGLTRAELQTLLPRSGARNALDCALWELEARLAGVPVWTLAGVSRPRPLVTTFTLPADPPDLLADKARRLDFAKAIKLKLEGDLDTDRERLRVVRSVRPDVWLSVDANQGFAAADLDGLAAMAVEFSVELIEQPVRRGEEQQLHGWRPSVPVGADESILDLAELHAKGDFFDTINIKLDKCGGLTEALAIEQAARSMGKQVMVGNMGGSTLAMAPGFVLAQLCDIVDLDGPWALADDPLGKTIYRDGEVFIPEQIWGGALQPAPIEAVP